MAEGEDQIRAAQLHSSWGDSERARTNRFESMTICRLQCFLAVTLVHEAAHLAASFIV